MNNVITDRIRWIADRVSWYAFVSSRLPRHLRFRLRKWLWYKLTDETPSPATWLNWLN